jgi:hypothetical protein
MSVRVESRSLDRLPSLSWQEQLPPLHTPLTAIRTQWHKEVGTEKEIEQQQQ